MKLYELGDLEFIDGYKDMKKFWRAAIKRTEVVSCNLDTYLLRRGSHEYVVDMSSRYCGTFKTRKEAKERILYHGTETYLEGYARRIEWIINNMPDEDDSQDYFVRDCVDFDKMATPCSVLFDKCKFYLDVYIRYYEGCGFVTRRTLKSFIVHGKKAAYKKLLEGLQKDFEGTRKTVELIGVKEQLTCK